MRVAFARMASKTGASSPREELMTFNTSEVAVSRWDASPSSRVSWSSLSRKLAGGACLIGALRALGLFVRGTFTDRPLPRQCIGSDGDGINSRVYPERGLAPGLQGCPLWINNRHLEYKRTCPLYPPKADMCSAQAHVCFGPKADSCTAEERRYSIISSAAVNNLSEMVRPSALAALRLLLALEDAVDISCRQAKLFAANVTIRDQAA